MQVCFSVGDQFDYHNEATIDLLVDRTGEQARPKAFRWTSLYDGETGFPRCSPTMANAFSPIACIPLRAALGSSFTPSVGDFSPAYLHHWHQHDIRES
jgi:hypothetical protein